jgi:hypothetical protein
MVLRRGIKTSAKFSPGEYGIKKTPRPGRRKGFKTTDNTGLHEKLFA